MARQEMRTVKIFVLHFIAIIVPLKDIPNKYYCTDMEKQNKLIWKKGKKTHEGTLPNERITTRIRECFALCSNRTEVTSDCFQLK